MSKCKIFCFQETVESWKKQMPVDEGMRPQLKQTTLLTGKNLGMQRSLFCYQGTIAIPFWKEDTALALTLQSQIPSATWV